jgi:hypothetical protein
LIGHIVTLGNDAVEADAHVKPFTGECAVLRHRRKLDGFILCGEFLYQRLERSPPIAQRQLHELLSRGIHEQIKNNELAGAFFTQFCDAAGGWMNAHQQIVER